MALRPQFALIHSDFNPFLFAAVGETENGADLTVLSALTRLGIDPWAEAARLSELPREAAARALAAAIALLPAGDWQASDASAIAARLVACLPSRATPAPASTQPIHRLANKKTSKAVIVLVCVALAVAALFALSHVHADHPPDTAPSAVSSAPR